MTNVITLLDTENGINNDAFAFWFDYGLTYVEVDEYGDVYTRSESTLDSREELEAIAIGIINA